MLHALTLLQCVILSFPAGQAGVSDWNNALKLGYDPEVEVFPEWLTTQVIHHMCYNTTNPLLNVSS